MLAAFVSVLAVVIEASTCGGADHDSAPSAQARQAIPADYLALYRAAGRDYEVPWPILAGSAIETDHGRSGAPGVRSSSSR